MPIYEYRCLNCSKVFEKIIWNSQKETVDCPFCRSSNNMRILSAFAKGGGGSGKGLSAPSACGPSHGGFS